MLAICNVLTDAVCSTYQPQLPYMQQCIAIGTKQCVHHMQGFAFLCVHLKVQWPIIINMHASSHAIMLPHKVWCA